MEKRKLAEFEAGWRPMSLPSELIDAHDRDSTFSCQANVAVSWHLAYGIVHGTDSSSIDGELARGQAIGMDWGDLRQLANELYREEVLRDRRMSPAEKFLAGVELFKAAGTFTWASISTRSSPRYRCRRS